MRLTPGQFEHILEALHAKRDAEELNLSIEQFTERRHPTSTHTTVIAAFTVSGLLLAADWLRPPRPDLSDEDPLCALWDQLDTLIKCSELLMNDPSDAGVREAMRGELADTINALVDVEAALKEKAR